MSLFTFWPRKLPVKHSPYSELHPVDAELHLQPSMQFMEAYWRTINLAVANDYKYRGMGSGFAVFCKSKHDLELNIYLTARDATPCDGVAIARAPFGNLLGSLSDVRLQRAAAEFKDGNLQSEARFSFSRLDEAQTAALHCLNLLNRVEDFLRGASSSL